MGKLYDFREWWGMTHTPAHIAFRRPWPTTRRGLVLWMFSFAVIFLGATNYLISELPPTSQLSLSFALSIASATTWGWIMVGVGFVSAWSSYCHLGRDVIGFVLLSTFTGVWGIGYACGFLFYEAGPRALGGGVIWLLFSCILAATAGFPNVSLRSSAEIADACRPGGER